jgi:hypothetical protein
VLTKRLQILYKAFTKTRKLPKNDKISKKCLQSVDEVLTGPLQSVDKVLAKRLQSLTVVEKIIFS